MGGRASAGAPFLEDRYRTPRLAGLFSSDPTIQALIQGVHAPTAAPTTVVGIVPGVGLPEMLPPGVAQNLASAPPQITGVQADPVVHAIMQLLQQIVEGFQVEGPQGGEGQQGGGGGGQQGGGGGGQQGGGGGGGGQPGLSPGFEANFGPSDNDRYV